MSTVCPNTYGKQCMLFWFLINQSCRIVPSPSICHSYHHFDCLVHVLLDFCCASFLCCLLPLSTSFKSTTFTCNTDSYYRFLLSGAYGLWLFCFFPCAFCSVIYSLTSIFFLLFHMNNLSASLTFSLSICTPTSSPPQG